MSAPTKLEVATEALQRIKRLVGASELISESAHLATCTSKKSCRCVLLVADDALREMSRP